MGVFANNAITDTGRILLADVMAGAIFTPTRIVIGSGSLPSGATPQSMADVITAVKSLDINKKKRTPDGKIILGGVYTNEDIAEAFYFRELALYAKAVYLNADGSVKSESAEVLYSYGNAGATADLMSAYSTSTVVEKQIDLVTWVGNTAAVNLTIDSGLFISTSEKGQPYGVAELDENGIIPIGQIPDVFIKKTGDTMTGNFFVERSAFPQIILRDTTQQRDGFFQYAEDGLLFVQNIPSNGDGYNRVIMILGNENTNDEDLFRVAKIVNGSWQTSKIYHERHKPTPDEIGAMLKDGYGIVASGTDVAGLAGKTGWYTLDARNTYTNVPTEITGAWAVLEIKDKAATLQVLNGSRYFCNNLVVTNAIWHKLVTTNDLAAVVATAERVE